MEAIGQAAILDREISKYLGSETLVTLRYLVANPGKLQVILNGETETVDIQKEQSDLIPECYIVVSGKRLDLDSCIKWHKIYSKA